MNINKILLFGLLIIFSISCVSATWWDTDYYYVNNITVYAPTSEQLVKYSTAYLCGIDTTTFINQGKMLQSGNDTALVYNNQQIDFVWANNTWINATHNNGVDSSSSCIYFRVQNNISASSNDSAYQFYYNNPSKINYNTSFDDTQDIFLAYDDFNRANSTTIGNNWSIVSTNQLNITSGRLINQNDKYGTICHNFSSSDITIPSVSLQYTSKVSTGESAIAIAKYSSAKNNKTSLLGFGFHCTENVNTDLSIWNESNPYIKRSTLWWSNVDINTIICNLKSDDQQIYLNGTRAVFNSINLTTTYTQNKQAICLFLKNDADSLDNVSATIIYNPSSQPTLNLQDAQFLITQIATKNLTSEGDIVTYSFSIISNNIENLYSNTNASLVINNTIYNDASKYTSANNITFIKTLTIPSGWGTASGTNLTWNWTYNIYNSTEYVFLNNKTAPLSTIVYGLSMDDCATNSYKLFNFTLYDENDATTSNLSNESIETYLHIYNANQDLTWNFTVTSNTSNLSVCTSTGVINNSQLYMDVITKYSATNYAVEYYYLDNSELTNSTFYSIPLYDLIGVDSTSFLVTYRNKVYLPIEGAIIELQRFYVGDGVWRNVEWTKTDENGQGVLHLVTEDVRYRTYVRLDNVLQFISSDGYAVCTATPCTLLIQDTTELDTIDDLEAIDDLRFNIEFDKEARKVNFDYTIVSGTNSNITMYTKRWDNRGNLTICSETQTATGGSMSCTIPNTASNTTYFVNVYRDNDLIINRFFSLTPYASDTFGSIGLIMTIVIFLGLSLIGLALGSGIAIIIFGILGIIFSGLVMIIDTGNFIGVGSAVMWLIIAGVIVIFKISSRRSA